MDAQQVLEHVGGQPHGRASFKHLARELRVRGKEYASLAQTLKALVSDGRLVEFRRGHYSLPGLDTEYIAGRFSRHPDGYGFVAPDRPLPGVDGDIFIPPDSTLHAMHHDRVVVRLGRVPDDGRAEGYIQRILNRKQTFVVGRFHYSKRGSYVVPQDDRIRENIQIPKGRELPSTDDASQRLGDAERPDIQTAEDLDGWIVNAELTAFPTRTTEARGQVVEILGRTGDFGLDVEIIIRKYHLPHRFSSRVRAEVEQVADTVSADDAPDRRDFRNLDIVTIDGETARDFDDAVWVNRLDNGNFALQVHVADVSHYVRPGSAIDEEAQLRGTSVYFPDRAVPMLPAELSTGICSLNPQVDRLVVSALMEINHQGETVGVEFHRGLIRSVERMTYTNVYRVLQGDAEQCERYRPLVERFEQMKELAMILNRHRERRGSIDFDLPETVIEFDDKGMMQGVARAERNIAHRIIEEFMLAANEAVAKRLEERGIPALYRIHEKPDPKRLADFQRLLGMFGYSLGVDLSSRRFGRTERRRDGSKGRRHIDVAQSDVRVSPRNYQKLIAELEGKPEQRVLNLQMLRSLKQARYSELNDGHFALATPAYTHFTSPIRRYPDLVVHRVLTALLEADRIEAERIQADGSAADGSDAGGSGTGADDTGGPISKPTSPYSDASRDGDRPHLGSYRRSELAVLANETSFTERRAADAERELIDWKKARYMEDRLGDEFHAIVVSVMRFGLFVELEEIFVEGLVPIESFTAERFVYRENQQALVGEHTRRSFGLGARLRVRADRIAHDRMRPEFSWVDGERKRQ